MKQVMKVLHKPNKHSHRECEVGAQRERAIPQPRMNKKFLGKMQAACTSETPFVISEPNDKKESSRKSGRRWKSFRSNIYPERAISSDRSSDVSCATSVSPSSHQLSTPSQPQQCEPNDDYPQKFYVPEEQDPLVQLAFDQDLNQSLSVDQCNKLTAAVAALDKVGCDLFAQGDYSEAFLRFERALSLKRRSLLDHSLAWERYEKGEGFAVPKRSKDNHMKNEVKPIVVTPTMETFDDVNGSSSLSSLSILKSHPTYKATENLINSRNQKLNDKSEPDMDEYQRTLIASVATSINNLTYLKQQNGQSPSEETLASYMQALQMKLQVLGPGHLSVGKTLNNIGSVFYVQQKYASALQAYLDAHCIMEEAIGTDHLDVATVASNIGDAYRCLGNNLDKALQYYREALEVRWKLLPHKHPKVTRLMEQIADLELKEGDASTFLTPRRSISFSDSENEDDDEINGSTRGALKVLKHKAQEDMEYINDLERSAAHDIAADKAMVLQEMKDLREESERELSELIFNSKNQHFSLSASPLTEKNQQSKSQSFQKRKSNPNSTLSTLHKATKNEKGGDIDDHTIDASDFVKFDHSLTFPHASSTLVSSSSSSSPNHAEECASNYKDYVGRPKIGPSPSLGLTNSENVKIRSPKLSSDERKRALIDVKERLARIRATRDHLRVSLSQMTDQPFLMLGAHPSPAAVAVRSSTISIES